MKLEITARHITERVITIASLPRQELFFIMVIHARIK